MNRVDWLLGNARPADHILEIGPSYSPIAPKAAGWRTHVVDHASREDLRAKYTALGMDIAAIEAVDSIWAGGPLHACLPADAAGRFDRLIASHVIEHLPNLVDFFESASRLLADDGVIALAVPDRGHCFDFFKPLTTTGDVLEADRASRSRHSARTVWSQLAYSVSFQGTTSWGDTPIPDLAFTDSFETAARVHSEYAQAETGEYRDCHAWQFTPSRFRLVMLELGQLGMIDWHVVQLEPAGAEFLSLFRRGVERLSPALLQRRRMELLYQGLAETREQIDRALGMAGPRGPVPQWGALPMLRA